MSDSIYIGVYGYVRSEYELIVNVEYNEQYDSTLETAIPLTDSEPYYVYFEDESGEIFFSFAPWWSIQEKRSFTYLAEIVFNKAYFYIALNEYPLSYQSSWNDFDDMWIRYYGEVGYQTKGAQYYCRARPDFTLADLASDR